ncbi:MAG: nucleotide exchange factor GrpE [Caldilineaceae bacterium]|nr:nucleotide exchange factor GrpE [Caldilineaceae bacterium]
MASPYHPFDPRSRRPTAPRYSEQGMPTLEDYEELVKAYRELQARWVEQGKVVKEKEIEAQAKDEVIKRQGDDVKQLEGNIKKLETELLWTRAAQQEKKAAPDEESWQERYHRLQAEVDNLRKRWEQRYESSVVEARHQILQDMLPLADHLDLALQHAGQSTDEAMQQFVTNIESTRRAFMETLRRYGIERVQAEDALFDPNFHEAIGYVEHPAIPAQHVIQVAQAGYKEGEKLLRPARVIVSKGNGDPA